jgi:hypothetical protein
MCIIHVCVDNAGVSPHEGRRQGADRMVMGKSELSRLGVELAGQGHSSFTAAQ